MRPIFHGFEMAVGKCKLTGQTGPLVKAHILPKALTYTEQPGLPLVQAGWTEPPIRRWTSWYDPSIVVRAGEDILEKYDAFAINELRRKKLIWSSWEDAQSLKTNDYQDLPDLPGWGFRNIKDINGRELRMFFLSLLWRAAVSQMPEFEQIRIRSSEIQRIRQMLLHGRDEPLHRFPVTLTQISTKGRIHNLAPTSERKIKNPIARNGGTMPIFRFYFDGLIAHFHQESSAREVEELGDLIVGSSSTLSLSTVTYEVSSQQETLNSIIDFTEINWAERLARLNKS